MGEFMTCLSFPSSLKFFLFFSVNLFVLTLGVSGEKWWSWPSRKLVNLILWICLFSFIHFTHICSFSMCICAEVCVCVCVSVYHWNTCGIREQLCESMELWSSGLAASALPRCAILLAPFLLRSGLKKCTLSPSYHGVPSLCVTVWETALQWQDLNCPLRDPCSGHWIWDCTFFPHNCVSLTGFTED